VPVYLPALLEIRASQHQLAGAGHEAVYHTVVKSRKLNESAGDYLCMFPILTPVYQFRLYHLAHHRFVNDPDFALLKDGG
jgi:fatty acid desaturase